MKLNPIITKITDIDAYKPNMAAVISQHYGDYMTKWAFKCRNKKVRFAPDEIKEVIDQIDHFCTLTFSKEEIVGLKKKFTWLPEAYIASLRNWRPHREDIHINEIGMMPYKNDDGSDCGLAIEADGSWLDTSMYEIAILAIVSEVWFRMHYADIYNKLVCEFQRNAIEKFSKLKDGTYVLGTWSEFGTRRRFTREMQEWLLMYILNESIPGFVGTSNVMFAEQFGIKAIGTQAHELYLGVQSKRGLDRAYTNAEIMRAWVETYKTKLGICLTDTIGTEVFLRDFDEHYATVFNGVRHDSGDPIWWGELMLDHYNKLGIDAKAKTLLFSDSLNFKKAHDIREHFKDRIKVAFGIGTYITCDLGNVVEPLNIVFKMVECNGLPVAKLSNCNGKCMSRDENYIEELKRRIAWRLQYEQ